MDAPPAAAPDKVDPVSLVCPNRPAGAPACLFLRLACVLSTQLEIALRSSAFPAAPRAPLPLGGGCACNWTSGPVHKGCHWDCVCGLGVSVWVLTLATPTVSRGGGSPRCPGGLAVLEGDPLGPAPAVRAGVRTPCCEMVLFCFWMLTVLEWKL